MARPRSDVRRVEDLAREALSDYDIARRTGIPRSTVQRWRRTRTPRGGFRRELQGCTIEDVAGGPYAYLLGQYLGDGTIFATGRNSQGQTLRISSDALYPGIIRECCVTIGQVRGRRPTLHVHTDKRMVDIVSSWKGWPQLLPQHGPGRKHTRRIALAPWQQSIVEAYPGPFLRGLIHSDGWRGLNTVHVKGRTYRYPRYQFSNRSDDIRQLFVYACELLEIASRPWGKWHISVARRDSVALLDQFVGPKS
jgi:Homeodomain-like domain